MVTPEDYVLLHTVISVEPLGLSNGMTVYIHSGHYYIVGRQMITASLYSGRAAEKRFLSCVCVCVYVGELIACGVPFKPLYRYNYQIQYYYIRMCRSATTHEN